MASHYRLKSIMAMICSRNLVIKPTTAITTISGAMVATMGLESVVKGRVEVKALQDYHRVA